ncbi:MAG TPA: universal stress protein [Candidatus Obscuribacterales bacterium]
MQPLNLPPFKVLIAIDEGQFTASIADFVGNHFWPPHTQFVICHVVEPLKVSNMMAVLPGPMLDEMSQDRIVAAHALTRNVAMRIRDYLKTEHIEEKVIEGFPKIEIVELAKNLPANLIVMGSHGRHGFNRLVMGSVSSHVLVHADCSVLIVRAQPQEVSEKEQKAATALAANT